jgi:hypothetical protein
MGASATFTELVTTTFRKHRKEIKDNMSTNNALLSRLAERGNSRTEDGGTSIVEPLDYAENSTYQRYSGYDSLNISASDVLSAAEYDWKQAAIHVVASGRELRINSGGSRIVNLAKARIKNAIRTAKNNFSDDIYSDGSATNQIDGLAKIVAATATNTVGGINASTWTFWQNQVNATGVVLTAATIEGELLDTWLLCARGDDKPDLIVMDTVHFALYEASQVSLKRYASSDAAKGGFTSLKYKTADVIYDTTASGATAKNTLFLNTDYLYLVEHTDAQWTVMDEVRPTNQDAAVIPILWMGNLVCSNRARQGRMTST